MSSTNDEVAIDDSSTDPMGGQTVHRLRANSSIMKLKKILGTLFFSSQMPIESGWLAMELFVIIECQECTANEGRLRRE
jgi:hypothetical protein